MALLIDKYPQKDFFVLDISDVVPKDDTASMEHPLFSLSTKPDMRHLEYKNGADSLKIIPSGVGLPTIFDKDILIFCISQLMHKKNRGEPIGKTVRFSARELSIATNRPIGGNHYKRLEQALHRLRGTTFTSNIKTGNKIETRVFGMIDEGGFVRTANDKFQLDYCEVVISDWFMAAIEANEVVSIDPKYFQLRRPLERRIYEICRKHCGQQSKWQIKLDKLQLKTGSNAPLKKFRHNLRQIITGNHTPFYKLELTSADLVIVRPRKQYTKINNAITIPEWADTEAREIAREKGWDYYTLKDKWLSFAHQETEKGNPPKNSGAAFVAYCGKQEKLR